MIYYIVDCWYNDRYAKPPIFHRIYKRRVYAQKAFEKYKPRALNNKNIELLLYEADTSETDEDGFYKQEWIAKI